MYMKVILIPTEQSGEKLSFRLLPEETSNTMHNENVRCSEVLGGRSAVLKCQVISLPVIQVGESCGEGISSLRRASAVICAEKIIK